MPVINWILNQQIQLGMILCACLFVPWGAAPQLLRSAAGGGCMGLSRTDGCPDISAALGKIAAVYNAAVWSDMVQL